MQSVDLNHLSALKGTEKPLWQRSHPPKIWLQEGGIVVRDLTPDFDRFALNFLKNFYMKDEPINHAIGMCDDLLGVAEQCALWKEFIFKLRVSQIALKEGSPGANMETVSEQNPPAILGLNLQYVISKNDPPLPDFIGTVRSAKVKVSLGTFFEASSITDVYKKYDVEHYLDGAGPYVAPDFRGSNVEMLLLEGRRALCRDMGIPAIKSVFTSAGSQKAALEFGYELLGEFNYADMKDASGQLRFPNMRQEEKKIQLMSMIC